MRLKKWCSQLAYVLTCSVLAVYLLISSPASAVDLNFDVVPIAYSNKQAVDNIVSTCPVNNLTYGYVYNTLNNACDFTSFTQTLNNSWGFSNKYYFKLDVVLYEARDREPLDAYTNFPPTLSLRWSPQSDLPAVNTLITFVGLNTSQVSEGTTIISYYYKVPDDMSYGILYGYTANVYIGVQVNELARVYGFSAYAETSTTVNVNQQQVVDAIEALDVTIQQNAGASASDIESIIQNQADSEREELEDAQDDAESAADDAGDDAEAATQSLTQTVGNVIDAIKNTEATNCEITVNIPGMINIGTLNMCNMPQTYRDVINYVTSGVLILAIIRTAYDLVVIYVDYIRSYQDGGSSK